MLPFYYPHTPIKQTYKQGCKKLANEFAIKLNTTHVQHNSQCKSVLKIDFCGLRNETDN